MFYVSICKIIALNCLRLWRTLWFTHYTAFMLHLTITQRNSLLDTMWTCFISFTCQEKKAIKRVHGNIYNNTTTWYYIWYIIFSRQSTSHTEWPMLLLTGTLQKDLKQRVLRDPKILICTQLSTYQFTRQQKQHVTHRVPFPSFFGAPFSHACSGEGHKPLETFFSYGDLIHLTSKKRADRGYNMSVSWTAIKPFDFQLDMISLHCAEHTFQRATADR